MMALDNNLLWIRKPIDKSPRLTQRSSAFKNHVLPNLHVKKNRQGLHHPPIFLNRKVWKISFQADLFVGNSLVLVGNIEPFTHDCRFGALFA